MTEPEFTQASLVGNKGCIKAGGTESLAPRRIDCAKFDATTEEDIARHIAEDEAEAHA